MHKWAQYIENVLKGVPNPKPERKPERKPKNVEVSNPWGTRGMDKPRGKPRSRTTVRTGRSRELEEAMDRLRSRRGGHGGLDKAMESLDKALNKMDTALDERMPNTQRQGPSPRELDPQTLFKKMVANGCPDCLTNPFTYFEGPSGGMMTNIKCSECGSKFNVSKELGFAERI